MQDRASNAGKACDVRPAWRSIALLFSKSWQIFFVDEGDEGRTLLWAMILSWGHHWLLIVMWSFTFCCWGDFSANFMVFRKFSACFCGSTILINHKICLPNSKIVPWKISHFLHSCWFAPIAGLIYLSPKDFWQSCKMLKLASQPNR